MEYWNDGRLVFKRISAIFNFIINTNFTINPNIALSQNSSFLPRVRHSTVADSKLLQTPCNTEDAIKGAIPKGTNFKKFFYFHT
jgi:hypothetical protein